MLVWEMGSLFRSLVEPLLDPGHRVYAPFLLTSLLLAAGAFVLRGASHMTEARNCCMVLSLRSDFATSLCVSSFMELRVGPDMSE